MAAGRFNFPHVLGALDMRLDVLLVRIFSILMTQSMNNLLISFIPVL